MINESELDNVAKSLVEEAKEDMEKSISESQIKKVLSMRLRHIFPKANIFFIAETVEAAIKKSEKILEEESKEKKKRERELKEIKKEKEISAAAREMEKEVLENAEKELIEEYCIPILEDVLARKISLVNAGIVAKNLYRKEYIPYESYRTTLHVLHAIGRNFLERNHHEVGIKTLENIASHTGHKRFIRKIIELIENMHTENDEGSLESSEDGL